MQLLVSYDDLHYVAIDLLTDDYSRRGFVRRLTRDHHEDTCTMCETPQSSSSGDGLQTTE